MWTQFSRQLPQYSQTAYTTAVPTGASAGSGYMPIPSYPAAVPGPETTPGPAPQTTQNILYTPGYLRTQLGRRVKVEFLIGTNLMIDREGTLEAVGANYIIIKEAETDDLLLCDLYSIKFVRFYY